MVSALAWAQSGCVLGLALAYAVVARVRWRDRDGFAARRTGQALLWSLSWTGIVVIARLTGAF